MQDKDNHEFNLGYLPGQVAIYFADALGCYRHNLPQAFAAMCRLTAQAVFHDVGESGKLKIFDQVEEVITLAGIDDLGHRNIRNILFDTDNDSLLQTNGMDRETAAVLLETMKDILHQTYTRRAQLRKKLRMRRYFAAQSDADAEEILEDPKVFPINRQTGSD